MRSHDHLGVCLDLCHAAVEFERSRGLHPAARPVGHTRAQDADQRRPAAADARRRCARGAESASTIPCTCTRWCSRGPAASRDSPICPRRLPRCKVSTADREWRVHFHVPIFLDRLAPFASTQVLHPRGACDPSRQAGVGASRGGDLHLGRAARAVSQRRRSTRRWRANSRGCERN